MEGTSTVLSIWRQKCDHSPEIRTFKTLSLSTSFEKLERNIYKKKKKCLPTDPNFDDHAIGNTHIFFVPITVSYYVMSLTALYEANLYNMLK